MNRSKAAQGTLDLCNMNEGRIVLPSPKRSQRDTTADGKMPWGLAYAAFSRTFALAAVSELKGNKSPIILDPFVGSGTTVEASLANGCSCTGVDLNPYSALTSRVRGVKNQSRAGIQKVFDTIKIENTRESEGHQEKTEQFYAVASLIDSLSNRLGIAKSEVIPAICSQKSDALDNELVALCSTTYAARLLSGVTRGSNPTWLQGTDEPSESTGTNNLIALAREISEHMLESLGAQRNSNANTYTQVFNCDFGMSRISRGSIRRFLTSPPYLNRLDYVQSNMPEIRRLTPRTHEEIESLRSQMMGTTKIRSAIDRPTTQALVSLSANALMEEIRCHPTKASATYYFRFFLQYFLDLERFFAWLSAKTSSDAAGIVVIQDSYYKDIRIPLTDIYCEVAEVYSFRGEVLESRKKLNHIGQMSPTQRRHAPGKVLTESVLMFKKMPT